MNLTSSENGVIPTTQAKRLEVYILPKGFFSVTVWGRVEDYNSIANDLHSILQRLKLGMDQT